MRIPYRLAAVTALAVCAVTCMPAAAGASAVSHRPPDVSRVVVYGFGARGLGAGWSDPRVRPHTLYLGNGGSPIIRGIKWGSWRPSIAAAIDGFWIESCRPSCAASPYYRHPGTLTLIRVRRHNGVEYFSEMIATWTTEHGQFEHEIVYSYSDHGGEYPYWLAVS
jgi:hypothetical protein